MTSGAMERRELLVAFSAIALTFVIWAWPSLASRPTTRAEIIITVVPPDAIGLECRSAARLGGKGCGTGAQDLKPYVTVGGKLVLLAGVFEAPAVRAWYASAVQRPRERVRLYCASDRLGTLQGVEVRFGKDQAFKRSGDVPAALVVECRVENER